MQVQRSLPSLLTPSWLTEPQKFPSIIGPALEDDSEGEDSSDGEVDARAEEADEDSFAASATATPAVQVASPAPVHRRESPETLISQWEHGWQGASRQQP